MNLKRRYDVAMAIFLAANILICGVGRANMIIQTNDARKESKHVKPKFATLLTRHAAISRRFDGMNLDDLGTYSLRHVHDHEHASEIFGYALLETNWQPFDGLMLLNVNMVSFINQGLVTPLPLAEAGQYFEDDESASYKSLAVFYSKEGSDFGHLSLKTESKILEMNEGDASDDLFDPWLEPFDQMKQQFTHHNKDYMITDGGPEMAEDIDSDRPKYLKSVLLESLEGEYPQILRVDTHHTNNWINGHLKTWQEKYEKEQE